MILGDADIRRVKLTSLNPAPYNPRKISDEAFDGLGKSIDQFGLMSLIVWNERTGNIVGGHQRYKKLVESGETETDVVVVDLDEDEEVALNITLNNPHSRGDFSSEVKSMLEMVEVQIGSAFNDLHLNDLYEQVKKMPKEKKPKSGDYEPNDDDDAPDPPDDDDDDIQDDDEPEAIIVCPECKSMWRMENNEVIRDGRQEEDGE